MARTVAIGNQDFESIRVNGYFYIDKTDFIREWWDGGDSVTLITRPRRFGKTLNMSMLEKFFSVEYAGRGDLFQGLSIWREEKYRQLQGTCPVLFISFADVKETSFIQARKKMCRIIRALYQRFSFLLDSDVLSEGEKKDFAQMSADMESNEAAFTLKALTDYLFRYYGKKVLIFLDEYDTPMQEAYVYGYWEEMAEFIRSMFNSTFKTNPCLERAVMTGITRISKESIFSDLNNLKVVTTTSDKYAECFGFTEEEVFRALEEFNLHDRREQVKSWYDGFTFGSKRDIYNPWSIINFLDDRKVGAYWANTSANSLVGKLIREGSVNVKQTFEELLRGGTLCVEVDEQIVFNQLSTKKNAIWSLLLASGYLRVVNTSFAERTGRVYCELTLTNREVHIMFENMIQDWFSDNDDYNDFIKALLCGDLKAMNAYMNRVTAQMFSSFDVGSKPSERAPERFYHGFVLGLMVELEDRYVVTSNRESGFGRYDVMLEPRIKSESENSDAAGGSFRETVAANNRIKRNAIIIEFKVQDEDEKELSDTVREALRQIDEKDYQANLIARGIPEDCIRKYGFAFCGKKVLIGEASI